MNVHQCHKIRQFRSSVTVFRAHLVGLHFANRRGIAVHVADAVSNLDFLPSFDGELERLWGFENQHDGASQAESAHLFTAGQWLTVEDGRRC